MAEDLCDGEVEPLVEGDGGVTVLVHLVNSTGIIVHNQVYNDQAYIYLIHFIKKRPDDDTLVLNVSSIYNVLLSSSARSAGVGTLSQKKVLKTDNP